MRAFMVPSFILISLLAASSLNAQTRTPAQLIEENRSLRDELETERSRAMMLQSEVDRLLNERRGLEGMLRQTEGMLRSLRAQLGPTDAPPPAALRATTPPDPLGSPDSILRELRSRHHVAMLGMPRTTQADRRKYIEKLRLWCRLTNREFRGKRTWLVTLDDLAEMGQGEHVVRMTVLDETSGFPIGDAVDVQIPKRHVERFSRGSPHGKWELTSIVIAKPVFNELRESRGVFEYPTFIGPMVEFDFEMDWFSLQAWEPGGADDQADPDQPDAEPSDESAEPKT